MRFLLFDRVTALEPGRRIEAVKCFSIQDEHLREHFPRKPVVPAPLVLEAMLQTLGWLVIRTHEFRVLPFFSMLEDGALPADLAPGVRLDIEGTLLSTNPKGSMGRVEARAEGRVVAALGRVLYGHHPAADPAGLRRAYGVYGGLA
jgi:3-hydroxyacyl-[acyl-carrier-protein] dehydratase